jgi:MFS family permease
MLFPTQRRDPDLYPYRHALQFAFFNALNWQVAIGIPTVLFMQHLGADSFEVGLVFAWTFLLTPAQVLATSFLPRLGFKKLALTGWSARGWCLLVPVVLAILAPDKPGQRLIFTMIAAMFLYSLTRAIGAAALTTWLYQLIPASIRGRYWSTDQMLAALAGVGILGVCAALFALLPPSWAFTVQYLIAVFGAWKAYRLLNILPDVDRPKVIGLERVLKETPRLMFTPSLFRTYLWLSVALFASITPIAPFTAYYLKTTAGLTAASIMVYTILTYFGVISANWFMRSRMDRIGAKPFFRFAYLSYALISLGWLVFLGTGGKWVLLLPAFFLLQGIAAGCWTSANLNYLAKILPEQDRALPVSIHAALVTFLGGCTPVIWGLILKGSTGIDVHGFEVFFAVLLLSTLVLLGLLPQLHEKAGAVEPLLQGAWLLRPFRAMANLINLVEWPQDKRDPDSH